MSLNHRQVAERWTDAAGDPRDSARGFNVYFVGPTIYSYGPHFPIASFVQGSTGERKVLFTSRSYSNSTGKHKRHVRNALISGGYRNLVMVENPSSRDWRALAEECAAKAAALRASAKRRRLDWRRENDLRQASEQHEATKLFARWQREVERSR